MERVVLDHFSLVLGTNRTLRQVHALLDHPGAIRGPHLGRFLRGLAVDTGEHAMRDNRADFVFRGWSQHVFLPGRHASCFESSWRKSSDSLPKASDESASV